MARTKSGPRVSGKRSKQNGNGKDAEPNLEGIEIRTINGKKVTFKRGIMVPESEMETNGDADSDEESGSDEDEGKDEEDGEEGAQTNGDDKDEAKTNGDTKVNGEANGEVSEPEDLTMKCEIKHLDKRYDDDDETYFCERKTEVQKPKQKDWWRMFAFCLVRIYDSDDELGDTTLYVNSQPLCQLLFDVIGNYPGNPIDVNDVQILAPYHSLFYYRKQLEEEGAKRFADDAESLDQLKLLTNWINTHFELDIAAYDRCVTQGQKVIHYDRLWTLFPPGTIAYCKLLSQNRAFRVRDAYYDNSEVNPNLTLQSDFIDFDGERLGTRSLELGVPKFSGTRELNDLNIVPIDLLGDAADVREELLARGRKFESYIGQHYLAYDGIAIKKTPEGYARFTVNGRVMIDCKTAHRLEPNTAFFVKSLSNESSKMERSRKRAQADLTFAGADGKKSFDKLSDDNAMLTNATVRGYSFTTKQFLEFFVEDLEDIEWNSKCFDELVLDPAIKKTVQALVSMHSQKRESFDDIVKGKGMGLVCVLHGPPGVGKTLTAECVAEFVKRPLYMVSSGDRKFPSPPDYLGKFHTHQETLTQSPHSWHLQC